VSAVAKSIVVAILGLLVAIILGVQIGQSSWMLPTVVAGGCVGTFIYLALFRTVRFEALILGFLIFGYIVGNHGFAQLSIRPNSPLYVGEVGMIACAFFVAIRGALTRERTIPQIRLAWLIVAFLLVGGVRLYLDTVMLSGSTLVTTAIRDSAVVYYTIFFFIAYQIGKNVSARKFVERMMLMGFVLLIPIAVLAISAPELLEKTSFRGYPLIQYKGDLLTTFLGMGAFYFFLTPTRGVIRVFFRICALLSLILMLFPMSRAALFGFIAATALLVLARRPQFLVYQLSIAMVALLAVALIEFGHLESQSAFFAKLTDRMSSIVDFSGRGHYSSDIGDMSAANNQFRAVWWKTVFDETMQKGPWFGLGFGYDLTAGFLRTYYANQNLDLTARSPHNILLTILGRMGVTGLAPFLVILFLIIRMAFQGARSVARGQQPQENLAHWCALINLLGAALFGVVLEGPMGGILFWSVIGLAASQLSGVKEREKDLLESAPQRRLQPALAETALVSRRGSV